MLHMSGCHLYSRCVLVLIYSTVFIIKLRWDGCLRRISCRWCMNSWRLQSRFFECRSGYFRSIIFGKTTNFLAHGSNEYYKTKIREMRIIEKLKKSKYEIFLWMIKILCLIIPPYKNQKIEKCQLIHFDECLKYIFLWTPFYLRNIIYLAKIMRSLLSDKDGIRIF